LDSSMPRSLYVINGSFYLSSPLTLRTRYSFFSDVTSPLICDSIIESIDIDTEAEIEFAKLLLEKDKL